MKNEEENYRVSAHHFRGEWKMFCNLDLQKKNTNYIEKARIKEHVDRKEHLKKKGQSQGSETPEEGHLE